MKDIIRSKEELFNILENGLWNSFKIESIIIQAPRDRLDIALSISEIYTEDEKIEVRNLVLTFYNIKKIIANKVHQIALIELVEYLNSNIDQFKFIGLAPSFSEFQIELKFGTIEDIRFLEVELECKKIEIKHKKSTTKQAEKFLSNDLVKLEIKKKDIPTALELCNSYKEKGIEIYYSDYWGEEIEVQKIKANLNGIFFKERNNKATEGIQISLNEISDYVILRLMNFSDDPSLFNIFVKDFSLNLNFGKISCGNVNFSKEEWRRFINSEEYKNIPQISTIET